MKYLHEIGNLKFLKGLSVSGEKFLQFYNSRFIQKILFLYPSVLDMDHTVADRSNQFVIMGDNKEKDILLLELL